MEFTTYKISIKGLNLHNIISFLQEQKIHISDVERVHHKQLIFNISKKDFLKLKKQGVLKNYKVKIIKRYGVEGYYRILLAKLGLIIGAITMALTTINLTSTIYSVSINTTNHVCQNGDKCIFSDNNISKLYTSLSDLGIKKGAKLNKIPPNKAIKNKLILNSPQISEVYIEQKGVYITVNILEAKLPTNDIKTDLVATHSGIVVKTDIISGEPKVKIGDIVLKGDTLIKNTGTPANGTVVLRAFYHENAIFDEKQITYERTGKTENINNISLFGLELNSDKKSKFTLFEAEEKHKFLSVNTLLPIKLHQTTFYELRKKEETISFGLKEAEVKQTLQEKTKLLLPKNAEIKNTNFTVKQEGSRFLVTCYIETYLTLSI